MNKFFFSSIKKWFILFAILVFPYLIVQIIEKATHNILTLGYVERTVLDMDSLGNVIEVTDSLQTPQFNLINQNNNYISNEDLIGYNYIVHFFFTSCPTICIDAMPKLLHLQKKIKNYGIENFKIISISVDPENDSPERLKSYAKQYAVDLDNWIFLTGPRDEIYDIARNGFFVPAAKDKNQPGGVFHSSDITLVDDLGYIRTGLDKKKKTKFVYDATQASDIKLLIGEIQRLSITEFKDNYEIKQK